MTDWSLPYSFPNPSPPLEKYSASDQLLLFLYPFPIMFIIFLMVQTLVLSIIPCNYYYFFFCFVYSPLLDNSIVYTSITPLWLLLFCFLLCFTLEREHTHLCSYWLCVANPHTPVISLSLLIPCIISLCVPLPLGLKLSRRDSCCILGGETEKSKGFVFLFHCWISQI